MRSILRAFVVLVISVPFASVVWAAGIASLSESEASGGLREALVQGAGHAVQMLGAKDGFLKNKKVKIPLPDGLSQVESVMRLAGRGKDLDDLVKTMNRAAEAAVPEAQTLLVEAVREMSVDDARKILTGGDDSATRYFKAKTQGQLTERFLPVVKQSTDRLALSEQYNKIAGQAASFGLVKSEDAQIEGYVTRKALDGLYLMIAEEEKTIRKNPLQAAGSLAQRVFGMLGH
ncbi:MAG TPA: DUF4197 domain-containing protein [Aromatoleum sp.]|uniref:DUF4197 domain-containing protein n=1 Tax=Aromatoleum sp. TaxID=2307007 RepID=UPI002B47C0A7|nr:DUF4197 domain-containing protein [Aromatoleum sp.]HJV24238.1 DUF4197 domain-containing protein [Aromatoleum sp.]